MRGLLRCYENRAARRHCSLNGSLAGRRAFLQLLEQQEAKSNNRTSTIIICIYLFEPEGNFSQRGQRGSGSKLEKLNPNAWTFLERSKCICMFSGLPEIRNDQIHIPAAGSRSHPHWFSLRPDGAEAKRSLF